MAIAQDRRGLTKYLLGLAVVASAQTAHAKVIFRDSFSIVNASCGDTSCSDCIPSCKSCPWDLSLTGTPCNHSTRTIAPCPAGRSGSCVLFNVTYCGGSGASSGACYRSEFSGTAGQREGFQYGTDYWFGFSLRLPDAYTLGKINPQEEIHFQMHGSPNRQLHEAWRNPIFALSVLPNKDYDRNGKQLPYSGKSSWEVTARGDPRLNITQRIKPDGHGSWDYKWENTTTIGDAVGGQWENFVYHTRYAYDESGFVEVWRNGKQVVNWQHMGTAFHDIVADGGRPPYMKIGLYKWGWEVPQEYDVKASQVTYAEVRVGVDSSYQEVDTSGGREV